jgi:hypothetical protein
VSAASGSGWTLVIAPGTYRETVSVDRSREIGPALRTASTPRLSAGVRTLRDVAVPVTDLSATARSWGAWPGWTTQLPSTTGAG